MSLIDSKTKADEGSVVPVVNIEPFLTGDAVDRRQVVSQIGSACEEIGFFLVTGHGVDPALIERMYQVSADFFALDREVKEQCRSRSGTTFRGYNWDERRETLEVGRYDDTEAARAAGYAEEWLAQVEPNVWPDQPPALKAVWMEYYRSCEFLARTILNIFASALELPTGWFDDKFDRHTSYLSVNHYPPQITPPPAGSFRLVEHTDIGSLTILYQDGAPGGLQVLDRRNRWCDVAPVAGSFVVNLGDLMAKWTNDTWIATRHRVVNPDPQCAAERRISIPFFQHPNYDALIECIPTCADPTRPARYPAVFGGNWAAFRMSNYETNDRSSAR